MRPKSEILGIHHVTAMSGEAQKNYNFYAGTLGLRLVKVTVNYDDPGTYHLYYGDGAGTPGSIITFFPWPGAPGGRVGTGQVGVTRFSIPLGSLDAWKERLTEAEVPFSDGEERFGECVLSLVDPDMMPVELVESRSGDGGDSVGYVGGLGSEMAIKGLHSVNLLVEQAEETVTLLREGMGFSLGPVEGARQRLKAGLGGPGQIVDVETRPEVPYGRTGAGAVHHVAWRLADDEAQSEWLEHLLDLGLRVTPVQDRTYFHSIYFREPSGVLYEIATDQPGFAVDEPLEALGTRLVLPPWLEGTRESLALRMSPWTTREGVQFP